MSMFLLSPLLPLSFIFKIAISILNTRHYILDIVTLIEIYKSAVQASYASSALHPVSTQIESLEISTGLLVSFFHRIGLSGEGLTVTRNWELKCD